VTARGALVTGGAGFIGSHTCHALLDAGWSVIALDNFDPFYDRRLKESGIAPLRQRAGFTLVEGDVRDGALLARLLPDVDVVVHLAARAGVRPSIAQPVAYVSINVDGTVAVLDACREGGMRRFVFGSSSSVYGDDTAVPFREDSAATHPLSPYAATKRAGELLCQTYAHLFRMRIAVLRLFTVYGPRQRPDLAIHRFTSLLAAGHAITRFGDGSSERDYTHVDDIVQGVRRAVEWTEPPEPACEIFNLGESRTVDLDRLIALISAALGVPAVVERADQQPGDVKRTFADISKARQVLGYAPRVSIEEGVPRFVQWYRNTYGHQPHSAA
jgi:UDP-glucuronate 4-epimerase